MLSFPWLAFGRIRKIWGYNVIKSWPCLLLINTHVVNLNQFIRLLLASLLCFPIHQSFKLAGLVSWHLFCLSVTTSLLHTFAPTRPPRSSATHVLAELTSCQIYTPFSWFPISRTKNLELCPKLNQTCPLFLPVQILILNSLLYFNCIIISHHVTFSASALTLDLIGSRHKLLILHYIDHPVTYMQ